MLIALIVIFTLIAVLPLLFKPVEHNLEAFLLIMGIAASAVSGGLTIPNLLAIAQDRFLYIITFAVLFVGIAFRLLEDRVNSFSDFLLDRLPLKLIVFLLIVGLGFLSSIITAIIASLLLTEILSILPVERKNKIRIGITACFSIGLGAVLTPIGEPLSTIVTSKLHQNFFFMARMLGVYILVGIIACGILGIFFADNNWRLKAKDSGSELLFVPEREEISDIVIRALKIFMFVVGLNLLGYGFKPIIDTYIIHWSDNLLYAGNMVSAILDNATLAAAEISPAMSLIQIKAILISLLVSGGMLITGNIPNIVTAGKLKISMKEWAVFGVPVGAVLLICYYLALFVF